MSSLFSPKRSFLRSEINQIIDEAVAIFKSARFPLPPFAYWIPANWANAGSEWDSAREARLGWDVTDFGLGNFSKVGRVLFTLRNGRTRVQDKPYAEKIILGRHGQRAPMHSHIQKVEDIINRGGGEVVLSLNPPKNSAEIVHVYRDGQKCSVAADMQIRLQPGESLCIPPGVIHQFWGGGDYAARHPADRRSIKHL